MAGAADRLRRLDQANDRSAKPAGILVRVTPLVWLPMVAGPIIYREPRDRLDRRDWARRAASLCGAQPQLARRSHRRPLSGIERRCALPSREPRWRHGAEFIRIARSTRPLSG